jgi:hypothetical protein
MRQICCMVSPLTPLTQRMTACFLTDWSGTERRNAEEVGMMREEHDDGRTNKWTPGRWTHS